MRNAYPGYANARVTRLCEPWATVVQRLRRKVAKHDFQGSVGCPMVQAGIPISGQDKELKAAVFFTRTAPDRRIDIMNRALIVHRQTHTKFWMIEPKLP